MGKNPEDSFVLWIIVPSLFEEALPPLILAGALPLLLAGTVPPPGRDSKKITRLEDFERQAFIVSEILIK